MYSFVDLIDNSAMCLHVVGRNKRYGKLKFAVAFAFYFIYGAPILDVSRSHTTTQHSR